MDSKLGKTRSGTDLLCVSESSSKQSLECFSSSQDSLYSTVLEIGGERGMEPPQKKKKTKEGASKAERSQPIVEINMRETDYWNLLVKCVKEKMDMLDSEIVVKESGILEKMLEVTNNLANLRFERKDFQIFKFKEKESGDFLPIEPHLKHIKEFTFDSLLLHTDTFILQDQISNLFSIVKNVVFYDDLSQQLSKDLTMGQSLERKDIQSLLKYIPVGYQFSDQKILFFDTLSFFSLEEIFL